MAEDTTFYPLPNRKPKEDTTFYPLPDPSQRTDYRNIRDEDNAWWQVINRLVLQPLNNFAGDVGSGFNRTMAQGLQLPIDVGRESLQMMFGGNASPMLPNYDPDDDIAGANAVLDLLNYLKLVPSTKENIPSRIGEELAWGVSSLVPVGLAAKGTKYTWGMFEPVVDFVRTRPLTATLMEIGLTPAGATGAEFGEEWGGETGEQLGRIAGYGLGTVPMLAADLAVRGVVGVGRGSAQTLGLTAAARQKSARNIFEKVVSPGGRQKILTGDFETPEVGRYTTGELVDDPGLNRLLRTVTSRSEPERTAYIQNRQDIEADLTNALDQLKFNSTQPEAARFFNDRVTTLLAKLKQLEQKAINTAQVNLNKVQPSDSIDSSSKIARNEIDKAYKSMRVEEGSLWKKIGNGRFSTSGIVLKAKEIVGKTARLSGEGGQPDIPPIIKEIAGRDEIKSGGKVVVQKKDSTVRAVEPIEEITALRSRLLELMRIARAEGRTNNSRQLRELHDAIYETITPSDGSTIGLTVARGFSKLLNDRFTRGPIGELLDYDSRGGMRVDPSMTLTELLPQGQAGRLAVEKLREASKAVDVGGVAKQFGDTNALDQTVTQYYLNQFSLATMKSEGFSQRAAHDFVQRNPALDLYPDLKAQMLDARTAQRLADKVSRTVRSRTDSINKQSIARKTTGGHPSVMLKSIFDNSKNPIKDARALMNLAAKDQTGNSTSGVKNALFELIMDRVSKKAVNVDDPLVLDAKRMASFIRNKTNAQVIKAIYGEEGFNLLKSVSDGVSLMEKGGRMGQAKIEGLTPQKILETFGNIGTVIGAKASTRIPGRVVPSLMIAGATGRYFRKVVRAITDSNREDIFVILQNALQDPDFAKELLTSVKYVDPASDIRITRYAYMKEIIDELTMANVEGIGIQ